MDRLGAMSIFTAVASAGSFSAASRELRIPLPTVSRRVADLEKHLDARLLVRGTRRLTLTAAGEEYLVACRRILESVVEAERGATGEYRTPQGELLITAPVTLGRLHVVPLAGEFLAAYSDVDVRLMLSDRSLNLVDEHLDLAVRVGELPDSALVAARVGSVREIVCASPAYLRRRGSPRRLEDLASHDCVTFSALASAEDWRFPDGRVIRVRSRLVASTAEAALDAAICGIGLCRLLSYQAAEAVRAGRLALVLRKFEGPPSPVNFVFVRERRLSGKVRAFLEFVGPRLRARLEQARL